jgi:NADH-quinone oxidoreductase subunit L
MDPVLYQAPVQSVTPWGLLWLVPLLPLLGAAWNAFLGPWGQKKYGHAFVHVPAVGAMVGAFVISLVSFGKLVGLPVSERSLGSVFRMDVGALSVDMAFAMDPLSAVMALVVTGVGSLIHIYSVGYMHTEKSYWRFFCYLNLFCFAMLLLVLGDSFIVMFFGWEGVGLCSYLLIGFWYQDYGKATAGMKAFVVNRIGDFGFVVGLGLLFWTLGGVWGVDGYRADGERLLAAEVGGGEVAEAHGAHAAPAHRDERAGEGLTVTAYPGATVKVDGEAIGRSPIFRKALPAGDHRVEIWSGRARS